MAANLINILTIEERNLFILQAQNFLRLSKTPSLTDWIQWATHHFKKEVHEFWPVGLVSWFQEIIEARFLFPYIHANTHEIRIHDQDHIEILSGKEKIKINSMLNTTELQLALQFTALRENISWNFKIPMVSFSSMLHHIRCRITLQHDSLSPQGKMKGFIRLHAQEKPLQLEHYLNQSQPEASTILQTLQLLMLEKKNILICGATRSGKTTLLKTLLHKATAQDHIVILEDTPEIFLPQPNVTHWQGKIDWDTQDFPERTLSRLCTHLLRVSPERIVLGEIRGSEVIPLFLLLNTGHQGLLTTIHASSALDAIHRLALLYSMFQRSSQGMDYATLMKFICKQIHAVIFMKDLKIEEIIQVIGSDKGQCYFEQLYKNTSNE